MIEIDEKKHLILNEKFIKKIFSEDLELVFCMDNNEEIRKKFNSKEELEDWLYATIEIYEPFDEEEDEDEEEENEDEDEEEWEEDEDEECEEYEEEGDDDDWEEDEEDEEEEDDD